MNFALKRASHRRRLVIRDDDVDVSGASASSTTAGALQHVLASATVSLDGRRQLNSFTDSRIFDTLMESFPQSAFTLFDDWCKKAGLALEKLGESPADVALHRRAEDLQELVDMSGVLRSLVFRCLPPEIAPHTPEQVLVAELIKTMEDNNLLYRERYLYEIHGAYVRVHNSLESKLLRLAARAYDVQTPAAITGLVDAVHEQLMLGKNVLRFNMAALQFEDATAQLQESGIHYSVVMPVVPVMPVIPRTCIPQKLCLTWSTETWNGGDLAPACLLPLLGAALRPPSLRSSDLRSVCLLLTSPETAGVHPLVWAIRQFGGFAVVDTVHEDDSEEPKPHQPFIFFVDSTHKPLTMDDCVKMEVAVRRRMTVVVHARSVPLMFAQEHMDFMRFVTVHVHREDPLLPDACALVLKYLLHAMTVAYSSNVKTHRNALSFLCTPDSVAFRLAVSAVHKSACTMIAEMLQSHAGVCVKAGCALSWADVQRAFAVYQRVRYPRDETSIGCTPADVLNGYLVLRGHFGYLRHFPDVVFNELREEFMNLAVVEWLV